MKMGIFILIICIGFFVLAFFNHNACADYQKQCYVSPIPTNEIVSPTLTPTPTCTPVPEISISSVVVSPSATEDTPTEGAVSTVTPSVQVENPASVNSTSPNAGSSANVTIPTGAPETGHAAL